MSEYDKQGASFWGQNLKWGPMLMKPVVCDSHYPY